MIGRKSAPDVDWYDLFDCSDCHTRTFLQGITKRRSLNLIAFRIPLARRWYFRCQSCNATRRVDEKTWRQWREQGVTPQEAYLEKRKLHVLECRSEAGQPSAVSR
jgi:hypothetical protein